MIEDSSYRGKVFLNKGQHKIANRGSQITKGNVGKTKTL